MKTVSIVVHEYKELSDSAKEAVIDALSKDNVAFDWWQFIFEDAREVGVRITSFNFDKNPYCYGEFIEGAKETVAKIVENHGVDCETYKIAKAFQVGQIVNVDEFLQRILENYCILLQKEYEYMTSKEAVLKIIAMNNYRFAADGTLIKMGEWTRQSGLLGDCEIDKIREAVRSLEEAVAEELNLYDENKEQPDTPKHDALDVLLTALVECDNVLSK